MKVVFPEVDETKLSENEKTALDFIRKNPGLNAATVISSLYRIGLIYADNTYTRFYAHKEKA